MSDTRTRHPYTGLPLRQSWTAAVGRVAPEDVTSLGTPKAKLTPTDVIATAGSCFAQHIARNLRERKFSLLDVEPAPPLLLRDRWAEYGYGLYSARYGNIYTSRQLRQLVERAFGLRTPLERYWTKGTRFFDPFRPNIEPRGFASLDELEADQRYHLKQVKALFRRMNVFIFTLGLTEAWLSKSDQCIYPIAPGVQGVGEYSENKYEFVNLSFRDVFRDLEWTFNFLKKLNPSVRFLLTVSPVPLAATASGQHVLTATTYSKSVLRAVAGEFYQCRPDVDYFPSYEMIAAPKFGGQAYDDAGRDVCPEAVNRVMNSFFADFTDGGDFTPHDTPDESSAEQLICEEAILDGYANQ